MPKEPNTIPHRDCTFFGGLRALTPRLTALASAVFTSHGKLQLRRLVRGGSESTVTDQNTKGICQLSMISGTRTRHVRCSAHEAPFEFMESSACGGVDFLCFNMCATCQPGGPETLVCVGRCPESAGNTSEQTAGGSGVGAEQWWRISLAFAVVGCSVIF